MRSSRMAAPPNVAGVRRKGPAIRAWSVASASGPWRMEEVGKHSIMQRTGLPPRDLRVLDPVLSYPSTILGRDRAIVVNLEHIKAIITATEVLVACSSKDPVVAAFLDDLQSRVSRSPEAHRQAVEFDEPSNLSPHDHIGTTSHRRNNSKKQVKPTSSLPQGTPEDRTRPMIDVHRDGGTKMLPFELKALEVCLESACKSLENEALTLDQRAYPALDQLTAKVSTLNLERVRQIKSSLVAITGRVQKVRDELEHLLDDDMDMAEMYLTEKLACRPAGETSSRIDVDNDAIDAGDDRDDDLRNATESNHGSLAGFKPNIDELEMLLEAYFVQVDGILNKLSTLREYVDDTEDYIDIMLDDKQNQLLQIGVMLSTATLVVTAGVVVNCITRWHLKLKFRGFKKNLILVECVRQVGRSQSDKEGAKSPDSCQEDGAMFGVACGGGRINPNLHF